ncbi:HEAT repeat domain-containing protein [Nocardia sp. NPDC004604]|uniref:HEAT repeat domain-containing protein n=1 Tax=Nocardia sp. NPDC004604 TaxID=3157013 RepID=UPI0033B8128D
MIGAFVFGDLAGGHAASTLSEVDAPDDLPQSQLAEAHELIYRPLRQPDGPPQPQVEYKLRRFVNDYVAPPKTAAKLSIAVETFERMRGEIAEIGARTPHELMRAVEVSFIRDCAEMAARSSLTRTESRWGLYHERADLPQRDDVEWRYHLNLRKGSDGAMEFRKRPVAPYLVPVPGLDDLPSADSTVVPVRQPDLIGGRAPAAAPRTVRTSTTPPSPRLVTLLALDSPTVQDLSTYLADPDAGVRVAALSVLTENTPEGFAPILIGALDDTAASVRAAAAASLRELVEVLPDWHGLADRLDSPDPVVRATVVDLLRARRSGSAAQFVAALTDSDHRVRIEAVRALVSLDDRQAVSAAATDENREVRIAVAYGLSTIGGHGASTARELAEDPDPLVRAAALAAFANLVVTADDAKLLADALGHSAWQVRVGAARGLAGADPDFAVTPLSDALRDPHLDVRKAAVLSLATWPQNGAAHDALKLAIDDTDADVRAYARRALDTAHPLS